MENILKRKDSYTPISRKDSYTQQSVGTDKLKKKDSIKGSDISATEAQPVHIS